MNNNDTLFSNNEEELGGMDIPVAPQCTLEERKGYACILSCALGILCHSLYLWLKASSRELKLLERLVELQLENIYWT